MSRATTKCVSTRGPVSVFVSYAREDEKHRRELDSHLAFLRRSGELSTWHDRMLQAGDDWECHVSEQLERADVVLLLVSPDFANSDYCWSVEAKRALERHEQGSTVVVPILVRPVTGWDDTPLGRLQAVPRDAKPVTSWRNRDEAYGNVVKGLRDLIRGRSGETDYVEPKWRSWSLTIEGSVEDDPSFHAEAIATELRRAANSVELELLDVLAGSTRLLLRSPQPVLDSLTRLHAAGELAGRIGAEIIDLQPDTDTDPGATLRVESRIVAGQYRSTICYLPEVFGGRSLEDGAPPLVGGVTFPLADPLEIGFSLLADPAHEELTSDEQRELQGRLGRYLNTFLVLTGDQVNVTLTPTEDYCGLPELLRRTELGRDMLAQDVALKHYTAAQLHPSTPHGRAFWDRTDAVAAGHGSLESCFRIWIVPGDVQVRENTVGDRGHVTIERLGLKVLCEEDYDTLRQYQGARPRGTDAPRERERDAQLVAAFREFVVPEIQKEVSAGPRFGLLRQILSVLVVSKWIMQSPLGDALRQAGFIDSNAPRRYGLEVVDDAVLRSMKRVYLQMFGAGLWRHVTTRIDPDSLLVERRLYVAGGIELCGSACR